MPIFHCDTCHHEWEGSRPECDWCGGGSYILKSRSELEEMCEDGRWRQVAETLLLMSRPE